MDGRCELLGTVYVTMLNNISQSKKDQTKEAKKKVAEARNISVFSLPKGFLSKL